MTLAVSVIVPVYKVEKYMERCTRSLFEQTLRDIEYIFVNDCTPDGSIEILQRVLEDYPLRKPQVKILENKQNKGLGATRKVGFLAALAEYVITCDSDDWIEPEMYEKMYLKAKEENADIVCCNFYSEYRNRSLISRYNYEYEDRGKLLDLYFGVIYSSLCNKLIRRELYIVNQVFPFEGINMWEDLGLTIRLRYFSKKTVVLQEALYHYNKQNEGSIASFPKLSSMEEQMRCVELVGQFFQEQGVEQEYELVIKSLKFKAKAGMLFVKPLRNISRWREVFPETHADLWKYKDVPWNMRFEAWLVIVGLPSFSCFLIDLKTRLSGWISKCYRGN